MARPEFSAGPVCSTMCSPRVSALNRGADAIGGDAFVGRLLQVHLIGELLQGYRRGANITGSLDRIQRPALALFSKRVAQVDQAFGVTRPQRIQQMPVDRHLRQVDYDRQRQLDGIGKLRYGLQAAGIHRLEQQGQQNRLVDAGGSNVFGFARNAMDKPVQHILADSPKRHQVLAQTPSVVFLAYEGGRHIFFCNEPGADQKIAQSLSRFDDILPPKFPKTSRSCPMTHGYAIGGRGSIEQDKFGSLHSKRLLAR